MAYSVTVTVSVYSTMTKALKVVFLKTDTEFYSQTDTENSTSLYLSLSKVWKLCWVHEIQLIANPYQLELDRLYRAHVIKHHS